MNSKDKEKLKKKIKNDEDFIYCPRLNNSMKSFLITHPDGVKDDRIAKVLLVDEEEVKSIFAGAIEKLRNKLGLNIKD